MRNRILAALIVAWIGVVIPHAAGVHAARPAVAAQETRTGVAAYREVVTRYCVTCHNDRRETGNLSLEKIDLNAVGENAEVLEKVLRKLRTDAMPPLGAPRPDKAVRQSFVNDLETALDRAAAAAPNPGRPSIHRLNRAEYANAIRDLLALEVDGRALLPPDDAAYGFDNIADNLSVSPGLFDRYMSVARRITRTAIGLASPDPLPPVNIYKVPKFYMQDDRVSELLPFGSRGGLAVRHYFPLDGEYEIKITLERNHSDVLRGMAEKNDLEIRLDRGLIKQFSVGGKAAVKYGIGNPCYATNTCKPEDMENVLEDANLTARFTANAGEHLVGASFVNDKRSEPEGVERPKVTAWQFDNADIGKTMIYTMTITGPFDGHVPKDTPSRRAIFVCRPSSAKDELACAEKILGNLARRAYRRPVTKADVQVLMPFYTLGREQGGFDAGVELALRRILVDPQFLFRIERDPAGLAPNTSYRLTDLELASRLSFFLWSSIPDDELLSLAERGKLRDAGILDAQTRRMLADQRSDALVKNFAGQWLFTRNVRNVTPDQDAFPEWDENLREAYQNETELFFASNLREDRSVTELLTANYTFLNEQLAREYQIPNVYGSHFRRVTLPADSPRRGLLGQGSILTTTSYGNRTSPVLRGKWLLENLLGAPPPAPPPDVPPLVETGRMGEHLTMRQRMEEHRKNPACAACHARMDPLGFALENFDGIGGWRTHEGSTPIDASSALPDGTKLSGPEDLRKLLLTRQNEYIETVADKLLTYAIGRGTEYYDAPVTRQIIRTIAPQDYRWSALISAIVKSQPFQMRRGAAPPIIQTTASKGGN
jgi:mono/diheme cytochrome c family protein